MKSSLLFSSLLFLELASYAQNLIPNGSFEEYYACPTGINQVDSCKYWYPFGGIYGVPGSPDYFNSCATLPIAQVPDNAFGTQVAFEGNAYIGLYTAVDAFYREFIGAKLLDTIQLGKQYAVSIRVSRGNYNSSGTFVTAASNKICIRLTTYAFLSGSILPLDNFAQFYEDSIIIDSTNWVLLHWNFIADSLYTHLYVGNFFDFGQTDTLILINTGGWGGRAYYFIDSVNIRCIDCGQDGIASIENESQLFYNALTADLEVTTRHDVGLLVVNTIGEVLYSYEMKAGKTSIPFHFAAGVYLAIIQTKDGRMVKKILVH
ncbi:MAG: T9SS type A sorting domain-containing protein [Bacteroidetes bacterium]|nr:T9SS type A sorting domain-containing protein [Bacteroidota bacterium]